MTRVVCFSLTLALIGTALAPAAASTEPATLLGLLQGHWLCTDSAGTPSTRSSWVTRESDGWVTASSRVETPIPNDRMRTTFERLQLHANAMTVRSYEGEGTGTVIGSAIRFEGRDVADATPFVLTYTFADGAIRRTVTGATPSDVRCTPEPPIATPTTCTVPNAAARTVYAAEPEYSADAIMQRSSGVVLVIVTLDDRSQVLWARVSRSASPTLDSEAERAARRSIYAVTVRNCRPVAGDYYFQVTFSLS